MDEEIPKHAGTNSNSHLRINLETGSISQIPESDDDGYLKLIAEAKDNPGIIGTSTDLVDDSQLIPNAGDLPIAK